FNSFKETYQQLKDQISKTTIAWGRKQIEEKIKELDNYLEGNTTPLISEPNRQQLLETEHQQHQEQLRKINLLFDPQATNYENIDFNGLYKLLEQIAEREREREREREQTNRIS